jgi:hypothetical protein
MLISSDAMIERAPNGLNGVICIDFTYKICTAGYPVMRIVDHPSRTDALILPGFFAVYLARLVTESLNAL